MNKWSRALIYQPSAQNQSSVVRIPFLASSPFYTQSPSFNGQCKVQFLYNVFWIFSQLEVVSPFPETLVLHNATDYFPLLVGDIYSYVLLWPCSSLYFLKGASNSFWSYHHIPLYNVLYPSEALVECLLQKSWLREVGIAIDWELLYDDGEGLTSLEDELQVSLQRTDGQKNI